jgi:hypothetical protein
MKLESQLEQHIRNRNNNFIFKQTLLFSWKLVTGIHRREMSVISIFLEFNVYVTQ